jgi:PAS domain S-box-containing protein
VNNGYLKRTGVFTENGELLYIEGYITDITERVLVVEKISRSEERMRILFEKNPQGILIADRNGNIINANSSWLKMFGYTYKDIQGLTAFDVRSLSEHETAGKLINSLFSGDVLSHHVEGLFLKKGGAEFWCDLTAGIISDPVSGENYAIVVYNDHR